MANRSKKTRQRRKSIRFISNPVNIDENTKAVIDNGLKIAVDCHVGHQTIRILKEKGYRVVYTAPGGVSDEQWINEALDKGDANVIISMDLDIPNYLDRYGLVWVKWVEVPQNLGKTKLGNYLVGELKRLYNHKETSSGDTSNLLREERSDDIENLCITGS